MLTQDMHPSGNMNMCKLAYRGQRKAVTFLVVEGKFDCLRMKICTHRAVAGHAGGQEGNPPDGSVGGAKPLHLASRWCLHVASPLNPTILAHSLQQSNPQACMQNSCTCHVCSCGNVCARIQLNFDCCSIPSSFTQAA